MNYLFFSLLFRMSFDEMRYLRTVHILHRVACQAVRIKFNSILNTHKLREKLTKDKGEITNIYKNKNQITSSEWRVLYPDNGKDRPVVVYLLNKFWFVYI